MLCKEFNEYTRLIPLTFLLGFYVSSVVSRWWSQFECLSWPEDLLSVVCLILPENTEDTRRKRHQIARYVNLVAAIAWRDVSDKIRLRFPTFHNLVDAGLMTESEFLRLEKMESPSPGVRWIAPLLWIQQLVTVEVESGRAATNYLSVFANEMKQYRSSFRKLFCHDWVCVPLVYTQVKTLLLVVAIQCECETTDECTRPACKEVLVTTCCETRSRESMTLQEGEQFIMGITIVPLVQILFTVLCGFPPPPHYEDGK
ncbi:Bestrophin [Cooperia oncophora]